MLYDDSIPSAFVGILAFTQHSVTKTTYRVSRWKRFTVLKKMLFSWEYQEGRFKIFAVLRCHIIFIKVQEFQVPKTMQNASASGSTSTFYDFCSAAPAFYPFGSQSAFGWQNLHYATAMLRESDAVLHKVASDILILRKCITKNNQQIISAVNMMEKMEKSLKEAEEEVSQKLSSMKRINKGLPKQITYSQPNFVPFFTNQPLITKIFDQEKFKFKLKLDFKLPKVIYKDRKLNLKLKLANPDGSPICNANLIHLCIGACDQNGRWILTDEGELFIAGKIEVDLYHGEAQFKRIYPSDISRRYSSQNIKIIIYPKRSLLKFTGDLQKHQKQINPDEIEPLIISDILVKAKKKV